MKILLVAAFVAALTLTACGTPVVLTTKLPVCGASLSPDVKTKPCLEASDTAPGTTFEQGLATSKAEKGGLAECGQKVKALQAAVANCDAAAEDFNAKETSK